MDLGSSQSSRPDRVAKASMKPLTYNLGSVKVTESSQFYNTKNIKGYHHDMCIRRVTNLSSKVKKMMKYKSSWLNSVLYYINILEGIIQ